MKLSRLSAAFSAQSVDNALRGHGARRGSALVIFLLRRSSSS